MDALLELLTAVTAAAAALTDDPDTAIAVAGAMLALIALWALLPLAVWVVLPLVILAGRRRLARIARALDETNERLDALAARRDGGPRLAAPDDRAAE